MLMPLAPKRLAYNSFPLLTMTIAMPGMPLLFIRSLTKPSTLDKATSRRQVRICKPDTSLGEGSNKVYGGFDSG